MTDYILRTPEQLSTLLQAFRKDAGMTQAQVASHLGVTQQTLSALERNAEAVSTGRLMRLLAILGVELVLRKDGPAAVVSGSPSGVPSDQPW